MIVFDLRCSGGHVFEAWFGSTGDYDRQCVAAMVACPLCGDTGIAKAVMAPAVSAKANSRRGERAASDAATPAELGDAMPDRDDLAGLFAAQRRLEASAEYVGRDFAARARALHDRSGDSADAVPQQIYGEANAAEAAALIGDGIAVLPLPFRPLARLDS